MSFCLCRQGKGQGQDWGAGHVRPQGGVRQGAAVPRGDLLVPGQRRQERDLGHGVGGQGDEPVWLCAPPDAGQGVEASHQDQVERLWFLFFYHTKTFPDTEHFLKSSPFLKINCHQMLFYLMLKMNFWVKKFI